MAAQISLAEFLHSVYVPSRLGLSAERIRQIEICIRQIERWVGPPVVIADLSESFVRLFLADLHQTRSAATVNKKRATLLALWRCAFEEELLPTPPRATKIRRAKTPPAIPSAWTLEEIQRVFAEARRARGEIAGIPAGLWWDSILHVAYDTGERRNALLSVSPQDISLDRCSVEFLNRKGGRHRWCPIHPDTAAACRRIYDPCRPLMWPFPARREALDDRLKWILKRAGVRHAPRMGLFHAIRRTSGTLAESSGADGAKLIGCTRKVFERCYLDPRFLDRSQLAKLPRV